ncbi:DNA internalization-related competence protein ComEC/Rec2 [candidate division KSB1 bacterium]|nr:MAG: DNA internalization-related competence protein ComEC/Rec2 [candidate division KSB1 bacterium]
MRRDDVPDLRRVPVLPFMIAAAGGVIVGLYSDMPANRLVAICAVVFLLTAFFIWRKNARTISYAFVMLFLMLFAIWRTTAAANRDVRRQIAMWNESDSAVVVTGRIWLPAADSYGSGSVVLSQASVWSESKRHSIGDLRIRVFADSLSLASLRYGDWIYARGKLEPSISRTSASVGSLVAVLNRREGAKLYSQATDIVVNKSGKFSFRGCVDGVRAWIRRSFRHELSPDAAALSCALLLGDRGEFGSDFSDKLRVTGLSHVFALSGVNVGIVVSVIWLLSGLLFLPRLGRLWLLLVVILFYMELGREAPSLIRASLMAGLFVLGLLLSRQVTVFNTVASAAFLELLWRPLDCLDAGFLLSYFSVLGLVSSYQYFDSLFRSGRSVTKFRFLGSAWSLLAATLSAQVATLPLVGFLFHRIPFIGAFGNLIAVPLFGIMLVWALLLLLLSAVCHVVAVPVAYTLNGLAYFLGAFIDMLADLPMAGITIRPMPFLLLLAVYAGVMLLFTGAFLKRAKWIASAFLFLACIIVWSAALWPRERDCTVSFIYVGNGDAALISTPSGRNALVDTGPTYKSWSAASRILSVLSERQIRELDAIILTHPDMDHIGGTPDLLSSIPVKRIFTNGDSSDSRTFMITAEAAGRKGLQLEILQAGDRIRMDKHVVLTVLSPDSVRLISDATDNQKSLVIRLDCRGSSALLPGDIDSTVEHDLIVWKEFIKTDLLKIAHHGSKTATCNQFIEDTKPDLCVISCGPNIHGHPHPAVFGRLAAHGLRPDVTWTDGTVSYIARNGSWIRFREPAQRLIEQWKLRTARIG